jgi:hypothetical protein
MKCAGLTGEQLAARVIPPSSLSLLGLIRHSADVERSWFRRHMNGEDVEYLYWRHDPRKPHSRMSTRPPRPMIMPR